MKKRNIKKTAVIIAAVAALLAASVSATLYFMTPSQVAESFDDPLLAEAFASKDSIVINESQQIGRCTVTLAGIVSGKNLSSLNTDELWSDRTYLVFTLADSGGEAIEEFPENLVFTPLVSEYDFSVVNTWTLGANWQALIRDGRVYYLYETRNLEMFADHTVYFAIVEDFFQFPNQLFMAEDGSISVADNFNGALFVLPLDESKADAEAVEQFLTRREFAD